MTKNESSSIDEEVPTTVQTSPRLQVNNKHHMETLITYFTYSTPAREVDNHRDNAQRARQTSCGMMLCCDEPWWYPTHPPSVFIDFKNGHSDVTKIEMKAFNDILAGFVLLQDVL